MSKRERFTSLGDMDTRAPSDTTQLEDSRAAWQRSNTVGIESWRLSSIMRAALAGRSIKVGILDVDAFCSVFGGRPGLGLILNGNPRSRI